jgi:hypothetical protein
MSDPGSIRNVFIVRDQYPIMVIVHRRRGGTSGPSFCPLGVDSEELRRRAARGTLPASASGHRFPDLLVFRVRIRVNCSAFRLTKAGVLPDKQIPLSDSLRAIYTTTKVF